MPERQAEADKLHKCHLCGERGRAKRVMSFGGELRLFCHDEEKSCFNDMRLRRELGGA